MGNNPVRYFDPDGNYRLDATGRNNVRFLGVIATLKWFAFNNPRVHSAFAALNTDVSEFAEVGTGPLLKIDPNQDVAGTFNFEARDQDGQTIEISGYLLEKLANAKTQEEIRWYTALLIKVILHETAHWAWANNVEHLTKEKDEYKEQPKEPVEMGEKIEKDIWGGTIARKVWGHSKYDPLNNPMWNASGEYDIDPQIMWNMMHNNDKDDN